MVVPFFNTLIVSKVSIYLNLGFIKCHILYTLLLHPKFIYVTTIYGMHYVKIYGTIIKIVMGVWSNGMTMVSKTIDEGSIPSAPVMGVWSKRHDGGLQNHQ